MPRRHRASEPQLTYPQRLWFATVLALVAVLYLVTGCYAPPAQLPTTKPYGIARLIITVDGEENGYCTVWKSEHGMAITAGHCCVSQAEVLAEREQMRQLNNFLLILSGEAPLEEPVDEKPPVITFTAVGNQAVKGEKFYVLKDDDVNDVCIMKGAMKGLVVRLAKAEPQVGEKVWTAGYPKGTFLISDGYWSGMHDLETVVASTAIWGGASGSPVMNADGEAVALLTRYRPPMSNMTLMTPLEWLVANLTNAKRLLVQE